MKTDIPHIFPLKPSGDQDFGLPRLKDLDLSGAQIGGPRTKRRCVKASKQHRVFIYFRHLYRK